MTHWTTKLIHTDAKLTGDFESLVTPVFRGSTTLFPGAAATKNDWRQEAGYTYGSRGANSESAFARSAKIR